MPEKQDFFRGISREAIGFYSLLVLILCFVWAAPYLVSSDGYSHAVSAQLIVDLLTRRCAWADKIFAFNDAVAPNWSGHAMMAAAIYLGASLTQAEKIAFSLSIILPAIAFRALLGVFGRIDTRSWLILAFALSQLLVNNGLYNYFIGFGFFLLAVSCYLRFDARANRLQFLAGFTLLLLAAWFSHIMAFLYGGVLVFVHETVLLARSDKISLRTTAFWQSHLQQRWPVYAAFIPGLLLCITYFLYPFQKYDFMPPHRGDTPAFMQGYSILALNSFSPDGSEDFMRHLPYFALSLFCLFYLGKNLRRLAQDNTALSLVLSGFLFWILTLLFQKSVMGGWMINLRLIGAGWYLILAACFMMPWAKTGRLILLAFTLLLVTASLYSFHSKTVHIAAIADRVLANAPRLPDQSVIFTATLNPSGIEEADQIFPLGDNSGYIRMIGTMLAERKHSQCVLDLSNYEVMHDYFPVRLKAAEHMVPDWGSPLYSATDRQYYNSTIKLDGFDPVGFSAHTGIPLDALVIFGDNQKAVNRAHEPFTRRYYRENMAALENRLDHLAQTDCYHILYQTQAGDDTLQIFQETAKNR